jgi:hypothetical protein
MRIAAIKPIERSEERNSQWLLLRPGESQPWWYGSWVERGIRKAT